MFHEPWMGVPQPKNYANNFGFKIETLGWPVKNSRLLEVTGSYWPLIPKLLVFPKTPFQGIHGGPGFGFFFAVTFPVAQGDIQPNDFGSKRLEMFGAGL